MPGPFRVANPSVPRAAPGWLAWSSITRRRVRTTLRFGSASSAARPNAGGGRCTTGSRLTTSELQTVLPGRRRPLRVSRNIPGGRPLRPDRWRARSSRSPTAVPRRMPRGTRSTCWPPNHPRRARSVLRLVQPPSGRAPKRPGSGAGDRAARRLARYSDAAPRQRCATSNSLARKRFPETPRERSEAR